MAKKKDAATEIAPVSNGGEDSIKLGEPYIAKVAIHGTADILFHRWNNEAVAEKSAAAKNSKAKKSDNVESYVYRDDDDLICLPGEYLRQTIIHAAKFRQDPRSPRKSAMDLYKAGIITLTHLAPINGGVKEWDYEHRARVVVQRNAITRARPAFKAGWRASFEFLVNLPEYISPTDLNDVIANGGKLVGIADFRPSYGRYQVTSFQV